MPRLRPSLIRQASHIHPLLSLLLPVCRDLRSAQNELRWLAEHARKTCRASGRENHHALLQSYIARRARAEPLQYILGSEFFGDLEIECRPGVLIPRQETASATSHLVNLLTSDANHKEHLRRIRVLDLCTGTCCIPLLFHHEFYSTTLDKHVRLELYAMDISRAALSLARQNLAIQLKLRGEVSRDAQTAETRALNDMAILEADVLRNDESRVDSGTPSVSEALKYHSRDGRYAEVDILISNPPYISAKDFKTTTSRSVRRFEPQLALMSDEQLTSGSIYDADFFYPHLLRHAKHLNAKIVLFEVGDMEQAQRVTAMVLKQSIWQTEEIWRDHPARSGNEDEWATLGGESIRVRGVGHGRSVFAYRKEVQHWFRR